MLIYDLRWQSDRASLKALLRSAVACMRSAFPLNSVALYAARRAASSASIGWAWYCVLQLLQQNKSMRLYQQRF
jgi:hypothetical protein